MCARITGLAREAMLAKHGTRFASLIAAIFEIRGAGFCPFFQRDDVAIRCLRSDIVGIGSPRQFQVSAAAFQRAVRRLKTAIRLDDLPQQRRSSGSPYTTQS